MPTLSSDFGNPEYLTALITSIKYGLGVLAVLGSVGFLLTMVTGGTQPTKWPAPTEH